MYTTKDNCRYKNIAHNDMTMQYTNRFRAIHTKSTHQKFNNIAKHAQNWSKAVDVTLTSSLTSALDQFVVLPVESIDHHFAQASSCASNSPKYSDTRQR